jgi:ParB family chromosome partitioning protein
MAKVRGGLGKGLNALIPEKKFLFKDKEIPKESIMKVHINDVKPNADQPRKSFDPEKLNALIESIKVYGVIQPIVVRSIQGGYEIIAGERRWKASKKAGLKEIPCIIKNINKQQQMEMALIENLQREDLNPIEEALAYKMLMEDYQLTQEEIATAIGKSRPYIANVVRLLNLTDAIQEMIAHNCLTSGHARCLLRIEDPVLQVEVGQKVAANHLSVRETESLIESVLERKEKVSPSSKPKDEMVSFIEDTLKGILGTKVNIIRGKKKGKIEIEYYSEEELERLVELLQGK